MRIVKSVMKTNVPSARMAGNLSTGNVSLARSREGAAVEEAVRLAVSLGSSLQPLYWLRYWPRSLPPSSMVSTSTRSALPPN